MRRLATKVVGCLAMPLVLAGCAHGHTPRVSFIGDSELDHAASEVIAAQNANSPTFTLIYPESGCGLMVDGSPTAPPGHRYCNQDRNNTQAKVDAFWQRVIENAVAEDPPDYIQVELGLNDAGWHNVDELTGYKARVEQFMSWLPAGVPVLWDNLPDVGPSEQPKFDAVNRALAEAAAETSNLHIVDLKSAFAGHWPEWYESDQAHYNASGAYQFARVNCQALVGLAASIGDTINASCDP